MLKRLIGHRRRSLLPALAVALALFSVALTGGLVAACGSPEPGATTANSGGPPTTTTTTGAEATTASTTLGGPPTTTTTLPTTAATSPVLIDPTDFSTSVNNRYFPLLPGTVSAFEAMGGDGSTTIQVQVLSETRQVMGVDCVVVSSKTTAGDRLLRQVRDWYAQDSEGNVWHFGTDGKTYENDQVVSTAGSWEAGVNGAVPGIVMKAAPAVGDRYQQAYVQGEVQGMAEVLQTDVAVDVPYGSLTGAIKTREWSPLEPGVADEKYYVPGLGLVLVQRVEGGSVSVKLISQYGP